MVAAARRGGAAVNLTDHFTLEELSFSATAERLGIDNTPPRGMLPTLVELARFLESVRSILGVPIKINSGYRCEELERVLCAKDFPAWCARRGRKPDAAAWDEYFARKAHPRGYAADFVAPGFGAPIQVLAKLRNAGLRFDQLIEEGSWVHGSIAPALRGEILTARFDANGVATYARG